jgi:hypothetical protein
MACALPKGCYALLASPSPFSVPLFPSHVTNLMQITVCSWASKLFFFARAREAFISLSNGEGSCIVCRLCVPRRRRQGRWCCDQLDSSSLLCAPLRCCFGRPWGARWAGHAGRGVVGNVHTDGADGKLVRSVLELFTSSRKDQVSRALGLSGSRRSRSYVFLRNHAHPTAGSTRALNTTGGGVRPTDFVTTNRSCLSFLVYTSALWRVATAAFQSRALCAASMGAATGAVSLPTLPPGAPCGRLRTWACGCTASV